MTDVTEKDEKRAMVGGFLKSFMSLAIKMATAGLTYLMYVVLSRTMTPIEYGLFAAGFSLATILSIAASMGQQIAILRFWPAAEENGDAAGARAALHAGWALTILAGLGISAVMAVGAVAFGVVSSGSLQAVTHLLAASLLILPLAMAEYASSALRAQGSIWTAMTPRDIFWRGGVPFVVFVVFYFGIQLTGATTLVLASGLLGLAMAGQFGLARATGYENGVKFGGLKSYWGQHGAASGWFFASTLLDSAALNVDIVLVGLLLGAESAGLYFNAFRTAGLMTLFMYAITLVIAPMVARYHAAGDMRRAQMVTSFCTWAGFVFSLGIFALFWAFGDLVMSLFGPEYAEGKIILLLLSAGLLVDAATGPTRIVMMMTGHEKRYVSLYGTIMMVGFAVQVVVIPFFGIVGAAVVNMVARMVAQTVIAVWAKRHIGLETSLAGIFFLRR